ncbi:MAG: hypothetical protein O3C40_14615 [Planctomycetota bacterium]|nr:hypothetical protein [Planctomycetota bacterium]
MTTSFNSTMIRAVSTVVLASWFFGVSSCADEPDLSDRAAILERLVDHKVWIDRNPDGTIRSMQLRDCCGDAELALMPAFPEMLSVELRSPHVTDAGLVHLRKLPNLHWIHEIPNQITDVGIENFAVLQKLKSFELPLQATDACMPHVAKLTNLMGIRLSPQITDDGLAHLIGLPMLGNLDVAASQVTNRGIEKLITKHSKLRTLYLAESDLVTTAALRGLPNLPAFQILLGPKDCNDETLRILGKCQYCSNLSLADYPAATDAGLGHIVGLRFLSSVKLGPGITDAGMQHIANMMRQICLDLRKTNVTGAGLAMLHHRFFAELFLPPTVGDDGLACLDDDSYTVDHLMLTGPYTDKALEHVAKVKRLRMLTLEGTQVTEEGLQRFQSLFPNVSGCVCELDGRNPRFW